MKTLGRNADNDLYLDAGGIAVLSDADAQCAIIESVLQTQKGELQFDEDRGIDYFGTVFQNPNMIKFWAAQVVSRVEALDFVSSVEDFVYNFDTKTGALLWTMVVINTDDERLELKDKTTNMASSPSVDVQWSDIYDKPQGIDDTLAMVEAMRDEAQSLNTQLQPTSTLANTKDAINRVVYGPTDEDYVESRLIQLHLTGVPMGTVVDFSNLELSLLDTGTGGVPYYEPYNIDLSDGLHHRITFNGYDEHGDEVPLAADHNKVWFPTTGSSEERETQKHTITTGGNITITIRGNISGISAVDASKPILLNSNGTPLLYLTKFSIGYRVPLKTIGDGAFNGFTNLQTINWSAYESARVGDFNLSFGEYAFAGCASLKGLEWIPEYLYSVGDGCFQNCSGLTSLKGFVLGSDISLLPDECFMGCSGLRSIGNVPSQISNLGISAFEGCTTLQNIDGLPNGIQTFGEACFRGCTGIGAILYPPEDLATIGDSCFYGCSSLRSAYIPSRVSSIGSEAFAECPNLTNIMSEAGSQSSCPAIASDTFSDSGMLTVYVPNEALGEYQNDWGIQGLDIKPFGIYTFRLEEVEAGLTLLATTSSLVSDSIWAITYDATGKVQRFEKTTTTLPSYQYEETPITDGVDGRAYITIKGYVRELAAASAAAYPFFATTAEAEFPNLKSISVSNSPLEFIGDYAFAKCTGLALVSLKAEGEAPHAYRLGTRTFWGCSSLGSLAFLTEGLGEVTDEEGNRYNAFGEGCFADSGVSDLAYAKEGVYNLPAYCFQNTQLTSLDGLTDARAVSLGSNCFQGCTALTSIQGLSGNHPVTELPSYCFANCTALTAVMGVESLEIVGEYAFADCTALTNLSDFQNANNLATLSDYMFKGCESLTSIEHIVNSDRTALGNGCFQGCSALESLMPLLEAPGITVIPTYCFADCTSLKLLLGCANITTIEAYAFSDDTGLLSTSGLGENLASIGDRAFRNCTSLKIVSIIVQGAVPTLSSTAFEGVTTSDVSLYVLPNMVTSFTGNTSWRQFFLPTTRYIKLQIENLETITAESVANSVVNACVIEPGLLPTEHSSVWYVDYGDGTGLVTNYGANTTTIGTHTYESRGVYEITLYGDIYSIGDETNPFLSSELAELTTSIEIVSSYLNKIQDKCFQNFGRDGTPLSLDLQTSAEIGEYAFAKDTVSYGPIGVVKNCFSSIIGAHAFENSGLTSSAAFTSVATIGESAFAFNTSLPDVAGFTQATTVEANAFEGCSSIIDTSGLGSVTHIGTQAFKDCTGLVTLKGFGEGLLKIENEAFIGCTNISTIFMAVPLPPTTSGGTLARDVFEEDVYQTATLYVPETSVATYRAISSWSEFGDRIVSRSITFTMKDVARGRSTINKGCIITANGSWTISYGENELTKTYTDERVELESYTFQQSHSTCQIKISGAITGIYCSSSAYPIFGSSVGTNTNLISVSSTEAMELTEIGEYVFAGCSELASVTALPTVTTIGNRTFYGCSKLTDISGLNRVKSLGVGAFEGCTSLSSLYGLHSVEQIAGRAFYGCTSLTKIDGLGINVASIGYQTFANCPLVEVQMFVETPPSLEDNVFLGIDMANVPLYVRSKSLTVYQQDSRWGQFGNIRSRYVEFVLAACPENLTVDGSNGLVTSNTFWVVDWDSNAYDAVHCRASETLGMPSHTYAIAGDHLFRIEGDITGIRGGNISGSVAYDEVETHALVSTLAGYPFLSMEGYAQGVANPFIGISRGEYSNLATIGEGTFFNNPSLVNVDLEGITEIGKAAFCSTGITSLDFITYVNTIGDYAFYGCRGLTSVTNLGNNAGTLNVGVYAFADLGTLDGKPTQVQCNKSDPNDAVIVYDYSGNTSFGHFTNESESKQLYVYVPLDAVGYYQLSPTWLHFTIASQVITFTLRDVPSGTTIIGSSLSGEVGTAKVVSRGVWRVDWNDGSPQSTMDASETSFPSHTYEYNESQADKWYSVGSGESAVWYRKEIVISISGDIVSLGCQSAANSPFLAVERGVGNPYLVQIAASPQMENLTAIGDYAFRNSTNLASVTGFTYVTSIGQYAFQGCTNLTDLGNAYVTEWETSSTAVTYTVGDEVRALFPTYAKLDGNGFLRLTDIDNFAFSGCINLKDMTAFPSVLKIGIRSFENCIGMLGISGLGLKYKNVSYDQFTYVDELEAIFNAYAFADCSFGIIDIRNYQKPPTIQMTTFPGDPKTTMVITSDAPGVLERYKAAPVWQEYWDNLVKSVVIRFTIGEGEIMNPTPQPLSQEDIAQGITERILGTVLYGENGRIAFNNNYLLVDWGDGTFSETTADGHNGWVLPNHFYTASLGGSAVSIEIYGAVSKLYTNEQYNGAYDNTCVDPTGTTPSATELATAATMHPFIRLATYETVTRRNLSTNEVSTTTTIVPDSYRSNFKITRITTDEGTSLQRIGCYCFQNCNIGYISLGMPANDNQVEIGDFAFRGCTNLLSIAADEGVISEVGAYAFYDCSSLGGTAVESSTQQSATGQDIDFILGATELGKYAFCNCIQIENISGIRDVEEIKEYTFFGCYNIRSLEGMSSVTSIGDSAFEGCSGLQTINLPASLVSLGSRAFAGCSGIVGESDASLGYVGIKWEQSTDSTILATSIAIGSEAFKDTNNSSNTTAWGVFLPSQVHTIGDGAFANSSLQWFKWDATTTPSTSPEAYALGTSATSSGLVDGVFQGCSNLVSVYQLPSFTTLQPFTFSGCSSLQTIQLPTTLQTIGDRCFENTSFNPNGLDLSACTSLTTINPMAFAGSTITSFVAPSSLTTLASTETDDSDSAFLNCNHLVLVDLSRCTGLTKIYKNLFKDLEALETVLLPQGGTLATIDEEAFSGCGITSIALPNTLKVIGDRAFYGCSSLTEVTWAAAPSSSYVTARVGQRCFEGCNSLETVQLTDTISSLGAKAFYKCSELVEIDWPLHSSYRGVSIGSQCFYKCSKLQTISSAFGGMRGFSADRIFFGCSSLDGDAITTILAYASGEIGVYCFAKCGTGGSVTIPAAVTVLGEGCFNNSTWLEGVEVVETEEGGEIVERAEIDSLASMQNKLIEELHLEDMSIIERNEVINPLLRNAANEGAKGPSSFSWVRNTASNNTPSLGSGCLMNCTNLANSSFVQIMVINHYAYFNCTGLTEFPDLQNVALKAIGDYAFEYCTGVTNNPATTLPDSLLSVGVQAYAYNTNMEYIPQFTTPASSNIVLGEGVFKGCSDLTSCAGSPVMERFPNEMFMDCLGLVSLDGISDSTLELGDRCFKNCIGLPWTAIDNINPGISSIGIECFSGCKGLTRFPGLAGVTFYSPKCFYGCDNIQSIMQLSNAALEAAFNSITTQHNQTTAGFSAEFYPRQLGIQYGWYIKEFSLKVLNDGNWSPYESGETPKPLTLALYSGANRLALSSLGVVDKIAESAQNYQYWFRFSFPSGQHYDQYANGKYTMTIYNGSGTVEDVARYPFTTTWTVDQPLYINGTRRNTPIYKLTYATDSAPTISVLAFADCMSPKESPTTWIQEIDLHAYSTKVVPVPVEVESDPFAGIPLNASNKKRCTLKVPSALLTDYVNHSYWGQFETIIGA